MTKKNDKDHCFALCGKNQKEVKRLMLVQQFSFVMSVLNYAWI